MWIFGYGSLMWDGWETQHGCLKRVIAELPGYRRAFNKSSVRNWGTKEFPCPTLNLVADSLSSCSGLAFQFRNESRETLLECLSDREGRGFSLDELPIRLDNGQRVQAIVSIYTGRNLIDDKPLENIAEMVHMAVGESGRCIDYVRGIVNKFRPVRLRLSSEAEG